MNNIDKIFDSIGTRTLFKNKEVLQANYSPEEIPYRDKQIEQVASILAPALIGQKTSNLFIYGKTGCISGDSLVYTNNGWKKIKSVDSLKDIVLTFNKNAKKYEWSNFIFLKFENKDKLLKIILDNGYELIVTKDHPLLNAQMSWKKAEELKLNEDIVISYEMPNLNKKEITLPLARLLGFTISDGSLNKRQRRVLHHRGGWYNSNKQRYGYFSEDIELLSLVQHDLRQLFKCTPQIIQPNARCTHVNVISQQVCGTLNNLGVPFGSKSSIVEVPPIILESSSIIQREFLKSLFSGDGTVSQQTYQIEYYSNSKKLLQQLSLLLHQEGIICKIRKKIARCNGKLFDSYRLYINGQENLVKFYNKIGFYSTMKQQKLKALLGKYVKNISGYNESYATSKIIGIEEVFEEYVYDLTVPKNHCFIANGIISHNTGKTLTMRHVQRELEKRVENSKSGNLSIIYINCKYKKVADTEYRILAELIERLGGTIPETGLPTNLVYTKFLNMIENSKSKIHLLILDEVDQLVKKISDDFLYNLTRLNSELSKKQIGIIGISNDLRFLENIDPRVKSSLSEEEIVFPPYDAIQLKEILQKRAKQAFKENVVDLGAISKCSAFAAREHGDARRALDLLRVAGEIAERAGDKKIITKHIDLANEQIERDKILDVIKTEPKQFQAVLQALINLEESKDKLKAQKNLVDGEGGKIFTGDVYNVYQAICRGINMEVLTQRRVGDIISEFDMLGLINAQVISKGRYGRTKEIKLLIPNNILNKAKDILRESLGI